MADCLEMEMKVSTLKQSVKQILIKKQHKKYQKEVEAGNLTYDQWIRQQEEKDGVDTSFSVAEEKSLTNDLIKILFESTKIKNEGKNAKLDEKCRILSMTQTGGHSLTKELVLLCSKEFLEQQMNENSKVFLQSLHDLKADVIFMKMEEGEIAPRAFFLCSRKLREQEGIVLVYGDEDEKGEKIRQNPWFKPDWSPDSFLSAYYLGGVLALRTESLSGIVAGSGWYQLLKEVIEKAGGFEKHSALSDGKEVWDTQEGCPVCHIRQILFHRSGKITAGVGNTKEEDHGEEEKLPMVSVIIPSKDNPEILLNCIRSFTERTQAGIPYEFLVVDNGSSKENRERIEKELRQICGSKARYLYEPMPFNFSRMCNRGAELAEGELLLFLNDDMEIIQPDWLELLSRKAVLPYAGAVGAKLLYPESHIIQHAGITNLRVGPAHKLQYLDDEHVYYFGQNRGVHDMIGVTAACLLVKKEVFVKAGGFYEGLAVAFNDVDLCYRIYELGYYNIQRNDVCLYHHESLSRGKDGESREKQLRLLKEKDILYERHQELYGQDPFYHPYLTTDMLESGYSPAFHYQVDLRQAWSEPREVTEAVKRAREDSCLVVGMECAMDIYKWKYGVASSKGRKKALPEDEGFYFQGYSFIIGADNACYEKKLLLRSQESGKVYALSVENRYRKDIRDNLKDQLNVDLTGFTAKLQSGGLAKGVYQFGMLAQDRCSRQRLVNFSSWVIEI